MHISNKDKASIDYQGSYERLITEIGNGRYMDAYDTYTMLLSFFVKYMASSVFTTKNKPDSIVSKNTVIDMLFLMKSSINIAVNYVIVESIAAAQLSKLALSLSAHLKELKDTDIDFVRLLNTLYSSFIELLNDYEDKIKEQCMDIVGNINTVLVIPPGRYLSSCLSAWEKRVPIMYLKHRHLKHPYKPQGKPVFLTGLPYLRGKVDSIILESVLVTSDKALVPPGSVASLKELEPKNLFIVTIPPALSQGSPITLKNIRPVVEYMMENGEIINTFNREILNFTNYNVYILTGIDILTRDSKSALSAKILSASKIWSQELARRVIEKYKHATIPSTGDT